MLMGELLRGAAVVRNAGNYLGAESQLAVEVPEVETVADGFLVQSADRGPPEAVAAGAVEIDRYK